MIPEPQEELSADLIVAVSLTAAILVLMAFYFLAPRPVAEVASQQSACIGGCHGR